MHREEYDTVEKILHELRRHDVKMYMSVGAFYTIHFIVLKYIHKEKKLFGEACRNNLRIIMQQILQLFEVAEHDKDSLLNGISDIHFADLEDSCQYQAAKKAGCGMLITFNILDYPVGNDASVQVFTPKQFLELNQIIRS